MSGLTPACAYPRTRALGFKPAFSAASAVAKEMLSRLSEDINYFVQERATLRSQGRGLPQLAGLSSDEIKSMGRGAWLSSSPSSALSKLSALREALSALHASDSEASSAAIGHALGVANGLPSGAEDRTEEQRRGLLAHRLAVAGNQEPKVRFSSPLAASFRRALLHVSATLART